MLSAARDTLFFITTHSSGNDKSLLELQSANLTRMCEMKKRSSKYSCIIIDLFLDYDRFSFALDEDDAKFAVHANQPLVL